jgi:outer membrane protein OmpA-like peptidoglycan-associated protein
MRYWQVFAIALSLAVGGCTLHGGDRAIVDEIEGLDLDARQTERGVVVTLRQVFFAFDQAQLTPEARRKIHDIAQILNRTSARERTISVEGHSDAVGSASYNIQLSRRRAVAVAGELAFSNVRRDRIKIEALGESVPVAANYNPDGSDNPDGRARNRRVEIVLLSPG